MPIETVAASIAEQGFAGLLGNLATSYVQRKAKTLRNTEDEIKTDFSHHLQNTFQKCTEIKTILSDRKPEKTLAIYVDQNFDVAQKNVDQYTLVERIKKGCSCVITGTGGGGKSMFMRYLWLSLFESPGGKIPFFLELRQLNLLTHPNIVDFIFHSIVRSGSSISQQNFRRALKANEFVLFFDGFDEINHDQRAKVENMLLSLKDENPELTMVVTSRPDERFSGWHQFEIIKVLPLTKKQVVELIQKAPYEEEHKSAFLKKIESLYDSHKSFMSTPLLAYMMLITFSYNQDIPKRMFLFYEQAFDALYTRHDLTKGGYRRKLYTGMERQDFIRILSYFSLKSYYDQNFEFTETLLNDTIDKAKRIERIDIVNEEFIKDMSESVCLLKKEGIVYSFTHRSFQEYFSANCIARVASRNLDKMFTEFAKRYNDSVMQMVYDINVDLFREKYIIPTSRKYKPFFDKVRKSDVLEAFFEKTSFTIYYNLEEMRSHLHREKKNSKERFIRSAYSNFNTSHDGTLYSFYQNILKVSGYRAAAIAKTVNFPEDDVKFGRFLVKTVTDPSLKVLTVSAAGGKLRITPLDESSEAIVLKALETSGIIKYLRLAVGEFHTFVNDERGNYGRVTDSFAELF